MANEPDRAEAAFAAGVTQRRKNLVVRCVIGVVGTLVFEPIVGVETAVAWTLLFITTQMFDAWVFEPITSGKVMTLPGWRKALGCLTMALSTTVYGAVSIPMWQQGGLAGGICAVLILAGGATSVVMSTAGSRLVLGMTLTPDCVWSKGRNRRETWASSMPAPVSATSTIRAQAPPSASQAFSRTRTSPSTVNFTALDSRLFRI